MTFNFLCCVFSQPNMTFWRPDQGDTSQSVCAAPQDLNAQPMGKQLGSKKSWTLRKLAKDLPNWSLEKFTSQSAAHRLFQGYIKRSRSCSTRPHFVMARCHPSIASTKMIERCSSFWSKAKIPPKYKWIWMDGSISYCKKGISMLRLLGLHCAILQVLPRISP